MSGTISYQCSDVVDGERRTWYVYGDLAGAADQVAYFAFGNRYVTYAPATCLDGPVTEVPAFKRMPQDTSLEQCRAGLVDLTVGLFSPRAHGRAPVRR